MKTNPKKIFGYLLFLIIIFIMTAVNCPASDEKVRAALFFTSKSNHTAMDELGKGIFDLLTVELINDSRIELVERDSINHIMDEYALNLEQEFSSERISQLGKLLGADMSIVGKCFKQTGIKFIVINIIDTDTSIIKDINIFQIKEDLNATLGQIAEFISTASFRKSKVEHKKFLAVGWFQDQSINDSQIGRGDEIRRFLELRYSGHLGVSIVTRSQMRPLLLEIGLNDMGFINTPNRGNTAQPAFTIIDGYYHIIRNTDTMIVVNIRVELIGKAVRQITVKDTSWKGVLQKIGEQVDIILELK